MRLQTQGSASVLVVMRQSPMRESIVRALSGGNLTSRAADDLSGAVTACEAQAPHLLLVDLDLGGDAPRELLGRSAPPAIGLTTRHDTQIKLTAFAAGADDVIVIPCAAQEIVARVRAVLRRNYRDLHLFPPPLKVGDLEIDPINQQIHAGADEVRMTALEHALLYLLATNAGQVMSRDAILDSLWGPAYAPNSNIVDHHIHALRLKLLLASRGTGQPPRNDSYIQTVRGRGYRLLLVAAKAAVGKRATARPTGRPAPADARPRSTTSTPRLFG